MGGVFYRLPLANHHSSELRLLGSLHFPGAQMHQRARKTSGAHPNSSLDKRDAEDRYLPEPAQDLKLVEVFRSALGRPRLRPTLEKEFRQFCNRRALTP